MGRDPGPNPAGPGGRWLNRTVLGIGLASLFSDWAHETATTVMPAYLASLGVAAAWLGLIEGVSDGLSSFAKMASGYYTDRLPRRKPVAVVGYVVTALGTASFALATSAWHVLAARSLAWLGRGVRTPVRKALMAGAVEPTTYGRAFGFERMMDTLGAVLGPATAVVLLATLHHDYAALFLLTLIPGLLAAACIGLLVRERRREHVEHVTFRESLRALPGDFRTFLVAVGIFGLGDFAHTLLILLAAQGLTPSLGAAGAATASAGLYLLRNVVYAGFALVAGWLADHTDKRRLLAGGYWLGAVMAGCIIALPASLATYALVFVLGGIYVAIEETAEDSLAAELVHQSSHGIGFGVLATVNGVGDFLSSVIVGLAWTYFGPSAAFGYSLFLFVAGALLLARRPARSGA